MDETPPPAPAPPAPAPPGRFPRLGRALGWAQQLALVVVLLGGTSYFLGVVNEHYPVERWLFWRYAGYWLLCAAFSLGCVSTGHLIVRRVVGRTLPLVEHLPLAFAAGVYVFFLGMLGGGMLSLYGSAFFVGLPLGMILLGAVPTVRTARRFARHVRARKARATRRSAWPLVFVALGLLGAAMVYFAILTPGNVAFDSRWQHLALAEHYVAEGGVSRFPEGYFVGASPHLASFLYTWAFLLPGGTLFDFVELSAHLEFTAFLWTLVGVVAVTRLLVPKSRASLAWVLRFSFPGIFLYDSSLCAGADHMAALFAAPIYCLLIRTYRDLSPRFGALLVMMIAGAFLTKYTGALVLLGAPIVVIAARALWLAALDVYRRLRGADRSDTRGVYVGALVMVALGLVFTAPQWAKNWAWYGDPLYPVLYKHFTPNPWTGDSVNRFEFGFLEDQLWQPDKTWAGLVESLEVLLKFSFEPHDWPKFHGKVPVFGSLFTLLLFTLPFLKKQKRIVGMFLAVHLGVFIWYWTHHQDRYLQAIVPWMTAASAAAIVLIWRRGFAARAAVCAMIAAQVIWGGDVYFIPGHAMIGSPVKVVADLISTGYRKDFEARDKTFAPFSDVGKVLPKGAKVLVHEYHPHLGLAAPSVNDYPVNQGGISYGELGTARAVYDKLNGYGVTHLVWMTKANKGADSLAGDLAFYNFALKYGADPKAYGSLTMAAMPDKPPPDDDQGMVAALTCGKGLAAGLYPLAGLHVPAYGPQKNRYAKPLLVVGPDLTEEDLVARARYVVMETRCKKSLPSGQGSFFRAAPSHGGYDLRIRVRGAAKVD